MSLLAASGELSPAAQKALLREIKENPEIRAEYESACEDLGVLSILPIPEPSAAERRAIPAEIKRLIHLALEEREKRARWPRVLVRWASAGLAAAACVAILVSTLNANRLQNDRRQAQVAQIHHLIQDATEGGRMATLLDVSQETATGDATDNAWLSYHDEKDGPEGLVSDPSAPPGSF